MFSGAAAGLRRPSLSVLVLLCEGLFLVCGVKGYFSHFARGSPFFKPPLVEGGMSPEVTGGMLPTACGWRGVKTPSRQRLSWLPPRGWKLTIGHTAGQLSEEGFCPSPALENQENLLTIHRSFNLPCWKGGGAQRRGDASDGSTKSAVRSTVTAAHSFRQEPPPSCRREITSLQSSIQSYRRVTRQPLGLTEKATAPHRAAEI